MTDVDTLREHLEAAKNRIAGEGGKKEEKKEPKPEVKKSDLFTDNPGRPATKGKIEFEDVTGYAHSSGKKFYFDNTYKCPDTLQHLVPAVDESMVMDETYALACLLSIDNDEPLMAYGPPGTGKTETPQQICARLGRPFMFVSGMGGTEPADYIGQPTVEDGELKWVDGDITYAVRHGAVLLYDEPFKSSAQTNMCLQSLMDNRRTIKLYGSSNINDRTLKAHEDFRLIMADNVRGTGDDMHRYSAEIQDQSTLNRHVYKVQVDYPKEDVEVDILKRKVDGATDTLIKKVVQLANLLREGWRNEEISLPFSLRDTQNFLKVAVRLRDVREAFNLTYFQAIQDADEKVAVRKSWDLVDFGTEL